MNGLLPGSPFFMSGFGHRAFLLLLKTRTIVLNPAACNPWIKQLDMVFFCRFWLKTRTFFLYMQRVSW
jgi:hypothetical protein